MTVPNPSSEGDILRRSAIGDQAAVAECIRVFAPMVLAIARQTLADPLVIEDAVQDVFIEIWRSSGRFDPQKGSARTFVATIARRRLIDRGRHEQSRIKGVVGLEAAERPTGGPTSADRLASREDAQRAARLIEAMGEPQRTAVKLSMGQGWSHQRISDHLNIPLGTVKTMLRRAIMNLREALGGAKATTAGGEA